MPIKTKISPIKDCALPLKDRASLRKLEADTMPAQVALELLSDPLARITSPLRRAARRARETHYVSTAERKPVEGKLAAKFWRATLAQLAKWLRRCIDRRKLAQRAWLRVEGDGPKEKLIREALELQASALDLSRDCIENELVRRGV